MDKLSYDELEEIYYKIETVEGKENFILALNDKELIIMHVAHLNKFYERYLTIDLNHPLFDCFNITKRELLCECGHSIYRHEDFIRNFMMVMQHVGTDEHLGYMTRGSIERNCNNMSSSECTEDDMYSEDHFKGVLYD